jgi:hypothetical protein
VGKGRGPLTVPVMAAGLVAICGVLASFAGQPTRLNMATLWLGWFGTVCYYAWQVSR